MFMLFEKYIITFFGFGQNSKNVKLGARVHFYQRADLIYRRGGGRGWTELF